MNYHQASQSTTTAAIIRPMFTALPLPRGIDGDELLRGYLVALDGEPVEALKSVVTKLIKGLWSEEVRFCPRPPELANMVRAEKRSIELMRGPRRLPPPAIATPFKDWRIIQRDRTHELAAQGFRLLAEEISQESAHKRSQRREFPAGSIWFWALQEMWGPMAYREGTQ